MPCRIAELLGLWGYWHVYWTSMVSVDATPQRWWWWEKMWGVPRLSSPASSWRRHEAWLIETTSQRGLAASSSCGTAYQKSTTNHLHYPLHPLHAPLPINSTSRIDKSQPPMGSIEEKELEKRPSSRSSGWSMDLDLEELDDFVYSPRSFSS
jgi:hypothetical protein